MATEPIDTDAMRSRAAWTENRETASMIRDAANTIDAFRAEVERLRAGIDADADYLANVQWGGGGNGWAPASVVISHLRSLLADTEEASDG